MEKTWDIDQSRHGERIWDIPQSSQERDTVGIENAELDRTVTAGQAGIICNLLKQQSAPDVDLVQHCVQQPPSVGYKNAKKI